MSAIGKAIFNRIRLELGRTYLTEHSSAGLKVKYVQSPFSQKLCWVFCRALLPCHIVYQNDFVKSIECCYKHCQSYIHLFVGW